MSIEHFLKDIFYSYPNKFRIACLRYFNPVGAHDSYLIGEMPKVNKNNLFPNLCRISLANKEKLKIYGNNWETKDGTCIRDYVHVVDIARGHRDIFNYMNKRDPEFIIMNVESLGSSSFSDCENVKLVKKAISIYFFIPNYLTIKF